MSWQPAPEGLNELVSVLRNSTSTDMNVQHQMQEVSHGALDFTINGQESVPSVLSLHPLWFPTSCLKYRGLQTQIITSQQTELIQNNATHPLHLCLLS